MFLSLLTTLIHFLLSNRPTHHKLFIISSIFKHIKTIPAGNLNTNPAIAPNGIDTAHKKYICYH